MATMALDLYHPHRRAMRGHRQQFDRTLAMPLIPFDTPHEHKLKGSAWFSIRFSEHPLPTPRRPENRYVSSAYWHPGTERDLS